MDPPSLGIMNDEIQGCYGYENRKPQQAREFIEFAVETCEFEEQQKKRHKQKACCCLCGYTCKHRVSFESC